MVVFALRVFPDLKDDGIQPLTDPADRPVLMSEIGTAVHVMGMCKHLLHFLESNSTPGICPQLLALAKIKVESHPV